MIRDALADEANIEATMAKFLRRAQQGGKSLTSMLPEREREGDVDRIARICGGLSSSFPSRAGPQRMADTTISFVFIPIAIGRGICVHAYRDVHRNLHMGHWNYGTICSAEITPIAATRHVQQANACVSRLAARRHAAPHGPAQSRAPH